MKGLKLTDREIRQKIQSLINEIYQSQDEWIKGRFSVIYSQTLKNVKSGMEYSQAVKKAFLDTNFEKQFYEKTKKDLVNGALLGSGFLAYELVKSQTRQKLENALLKTPWTPDRVPLSKRLHSNIAQSIAFIQNEINQALKDGKGAQKIAVNLFDGYGYGQNLKAKTSDAQFAINKKLNELAKFRIGGEQIENIAPEELSAMRDYINKLKSNKPWNQNARNTELKQAYSDLLDAIEFGTTEQVNKRLWIALQEKSRYTALRIARTELARAHYDGFIADISENPDISLIKFSLSPSHKITDICDFHTGLDIGYGRGVYPVEQAPKYPFHPHCRCNFVDYIKPNVKKVPDNEIKKHAKEWLLKNDDKRHSVLGSFERENEFLKGANPFEQMRNFKGYESPKSRIQKIINEAKLEKV